MERTLCDCGCCEGVTLLTPLPEENLPGLSALLYRVGTHGSFNASMHANIRSHSGLLDLKTRSTADPTIALIDAWAMVMDVLSFYQERIVNEGYLRTATERRSLLELARAIGYELRPGVAASAWLAFALETAAGAPAQATIPMGTKAQSIPGQNETAQTFETIEDIVARPEWGELALRPGQPQALSIDGAALHYAVEPATDARFLYFAGTATGLKPNDLLLIVTGASGSIAKRVVAVLADTARNETRVEIEAAATAPKDPPPASPPTTYDPIVLPPDLPPIPFTKPIVRAFLSIRWRESDLQSFLTAARWDAGDLLDLVAEIATDPVSGQSVHALRQRAGFFGNNAPVYDSLTHLVPSGGSFTSAPLYTPSWDSAGWSIWKSYPANANYGGASNPDVFLERTLDGIAQGSWAVIVQGSVRTAFRVAGVEESSLAAFGVSGKVTGLQLTDPSGAAATIDDSLLVRNATAHVASEKLTLAELPLPDTLAKGSTSLTFNRMIVGLLPGRLISLQGEQLDAPGVLRNEMLTVDEIIHYQGLSTIQFHTLPSQGLQYGYRAGSVTLNANVAKATHGESKSEVLGSGDASLPNQQFSLKQSPLTFVSASTPSGAESTLVVRANDLLWKEEPGFFPVPSDEKAFITRRSDDGTTTVMFGDGARGRRLPTGVENVTAAYRVGSGLAGNVRAGQIAMLMTRPLGVKGVGNPIAASGGADPEARDDARVNAPLTVLTLDRIVSLQDFEDFTRAFAGIGKALVTWLWDGEKKLIHLTVAAAGGATVNPASPLIANLAAGIEAARDPGYHVQIDSFEALFFSVVGKILVNGDYEKEKVFAAVVAAVSDAFSFPNRNFGQGVTRSELEALMQRVEGVDAVDLDAFFITAFGDTGADMLPAQTAHWDDASHTIRAAQLLLVNPNDIRLTEMQA